MELIKKWLSGKQNFHVGVILYNRFGQDENLKKYFTGLPDKVKQVRLFKELTLIVQSPPDPPILQASDEMPETNEPVLSALQTEWKPLYQRMQYLRYELDRYEGNAAPAVAQRFTMAREILELEQACMRIWERRDHYLSHGSLPEVKPNQDPLPTDPIELAKLISNTERNLRRNKKLVKDFPADTTYPLKVKVYQELYDRIMKQKNDGKGS